MENLVNKIGNTELYVINGDITQIPTDAIMTAINSGGLWFGGIDRTIQRVAGGRYHSQAAARMPLSNLQSIVAKGNKANHNGQFNDVVFVVDNLQSPLEQVVYKGLETADKESYKKILLPAIRMGVMAGEVEKTPEEAVSRIGEGINSFMKKYGKNTQLKNITFVIYNDMKTAEKLAAGLRNIENSKN